LYCRQIAAGAERQQRETLLSGVATADALVAQGNIAAARPLVSDRSTNRVSYLTVSLDNHRLSISWR
jgi:hypothetical protein